MKCKPSVSVENVSKVIGFFLLLTNYCPFFLEMRAREVLDLPLPPMHIDIAGAGGE